MRLHIRIFTLILLLLLGLGGSNVLFFYESARVKTENDAGDALQLAQRAFADAFKNRRLELIRNVRTVGNDWALRQAIGQQDRQTVQDVLVNHSNRVDADVALFINDKRQLIASTVGGVNQLPDSVLQMLDKRQAEAAHLFAEIDGRYYQLVMENVNAPVFIGWLGMGFLIDNNLAGRFSHLTDVGVSFVHSTSSTTEVFSTSLADSARAVTASTPANTTDALWSVAGDGWEDLVMHYRPDPKHPAHVVVLQKSMSEPLLKFRSWWWSLLTIFTGAAVLALGVAYVFARGITRPLNELVKVTEDIESGVYSNSIEVSRNDEIGSLASSFARMQQSISERETEIRYRADYDLTTGVFNRNGFLEALAQNLDSAHQDHAALAVLSIRVSHFQQIVDALGHSWGDKLLKLIAERLTGTFTGGHLAHVSADEFCMMFFPGDIAAIYSLGERVHDCMAEEFAIRGFMLTLTVRIGISVYPDHATDAQNLLRRASVALNEAGTRHKQTAVYDQSLDHNSVKRLTLMSELPKAIKDGQLQLHYQPQIRCGDSQPVVDGVEALVRWFHPELGFIPPDEFIDLAEKTGYIVQLTQHVLGIAIAQAAAWRQRGLALRVSVNISAVDLQQSSLASTIRQLLDEHRLPAELLCLEITESAAMQNPDAAVKRLSALKALGVRLSIDDYGTGYSSLAQLKKLPVHELKIDKSFVLELDRNGDDQIIVRSTIELAHNIGLEVVAEGVESSRILWQLDNWKANYAQGFYISKPLPINEFEQWLESCSYTTVPVAVPLHGVKHSA